jgi:hypothetical protein
VLAVAGAVLAVQAVQPCLVAVQQVFLQAAVLPGLGAAEEGSVHPGAAALHPPGEPAAAAAAAAATVLRHELDVLTMSVGVVMLWWWCCWLARYWLLLLQSVSIRRISDFSDFSD